MNECIVLCVDDDQSLLSALRIVLAKQLGPGCVLEIAESGDEALELEAELREQGRELGVVISDFIMPGMRGDELLVRLHQRNPATVTLMLTGQSDLRGIQRATNEAKLYKFIEKPFSNDDLVAQARDAVASYRRQRQLAQETARLQAQHAALQEQAERAALALRDTQQHLQALCAPKAPD